MLINQVLITIFMVTAYSTGCTNILRHLNILDLKLYTGFLMQMKIYNII